MNIFKFINVTNANFRKDKYIVYVIIRQNRLPREAAVNNCCVIVGKKGSSVFFEDISIPSDYKFDKIDLSKIVNKIQFVMENYEDCKNDFIYYRSRIFTEKERFYKDIDDIFNMKT